MAAQTVQLQQGALRVSATLNQGTLAETWQLKQGSTWQTILTYRGPRLASSPAVLPQWTALSKQGGHLEKLATRFPP